MDKKAKIQSEIDNLKLNLESQIKQLDNWKALWDTDWITKLHIEEYANMKWVFHEAQIVKIQNSIAYYQQQLDAV
jgi:hypothetical protein